MTTTETQVQVQDKLVEIDNLITALQYLKQRIEADMPTTEAIAQHVTQNLSPTYIERGVRDIANRYFRDHLYMRGLLGEIFRECITFEVNEDLMKQTIREISLEYIQGDAFRDRATTYVKRYALPKWKEELIQENKEEIDKHLESYIMAKVDERVAIAFANRNS